jgi:hypothetical protein
MKICALRGYYGDRCARNATIAGKAAVPYGMASGLRIRF